MMDKQLNTESEFIKILLIEDNPGDARLIHEMLAERNNKKIEWNNNLSKGIESLSGMQFDIILLDLSLPDSHGITTVERILKNAKNIPMVVLTGLDDEDMGVKAVKKGAQDYLVKGQLDGNILSRVIQYAIERQKLIVDLQDALENIKTLKGLLPICASCKNILDNKGYWNKIEKYIHEHTDAQLSHGICPECAEKLYPEYYEKE
jgi:CheY-like chemotaxis protein